QHHHDAKDAEDQFRQEADVVGTRDHRAPRVGCETVVLCERTEALARACEAGLRAGLMELSHNIGATPITIAAAASGHRMTRSRAIASARPAFAGLRFVP